MTDESEATVNGTLRILAPQVLGALVRRYGRFDPAEDAVQEALLKASQQWPESGIPERPFGWLLQVASRKLIDLLRAEQARREREVRAAREDVGEHQGDADDTLILLLLCCHPALTAASQIALTLRAVGGLTTAEIARAFLTSEDSMTRRISRAKRTVQDSGVPFRMPPEEARRERLDAVLHVLYLIFTEGYSATSGPDLHRGDLVAEAIRLAEMTAALLPDDSEAAGLLALMLLTDARSPARVTEQGELVPLHEQDRTQWKADSIRRGVELVTAALPRGPVGPYQLQAADRGGPRRGTRRGGDRLAADRRALPAAAQGFGESGREGEPRRRGRDGGRAGGGARTACGAGQPRPAILCGAGTSSGKGGRPRSSPERLPARGRARYQHPSGAVSQRPRPAALRRS
ncbi:DUF6596 domain-containing protein [Amycolatopsis sp. NPDC004079]|uniref:RNA polymerase sigma factor n=1 Tax=Amycolatopsis sp. NPDC004079 TaxID=3154549 RepID=UPI0033AE71EE